MDEGDLMTVVIVQGMYHRAVDLGCIWGRALNPVGNDGALFTTSPLPDHVDKFTDAGF